MEYLFEDSTNVEFKGIYRDFDKRVGALFSVREKGENPQYLFYTKGELHKIDQGEGQSRWAELLTNNPEVLETAQDAFDELKVGTLGKPAILVSRREGATGNFVVDPADIANRTYFSRATRRGFIKRHKFNPASSPR